MEISQIYEEEPHGTVLMVRSCGSMLMVRSGANMSSLLSFMNNALGLFWYLHNFSPHRKHSNFQSYITRCRKFTSFPIPQGRASICVSLMSKV
jgi:hypothetical protein